MTPPRKIGMNLDEVVVISCTVSFSSQMVVYPSGSRKGMNILDIAFLEDGRVLLFEQIICVSVHSS